MFFFKKKQMFILLISLILIVGIIGFSLRDRSNLTMVEDFIHDSVGWLQRVVNAPVDFTTSVVANMKDIRNVYKENTILKSRLEELRQLEYENQELTKEIGELEKILGKKESDFLQNFTTIQASIISRSKDNWFKQVTINKGTEDGVEPNMAVITREGMIGKVHASSPFTSTVLLLTGFDRSNRISVNVNQEEKTEDLSGFIVGYDDEKNLLLLEMNEDDQGLKKGQTVFSSGEGGVFPKGLEIGELVEVNDDRYGLTKIGYVKPSANLNEVNHVMVFDRDMATSDEEGES